MIENCVCYCLFFYQLMGRWFFVQLDWICKTWPTSRYFIEQSGESMGGLRRDV